MRDWKGMKRKEENEEEKGKEQRWGKRDKKMKV